MLDALRRGSTGWVAKILFAILVASFAIWGVADVFTGFGRGSLAKVGSQDIRVEDFQRQLQNEIQMISRQSGQRISMEQARAAGLDNRVLAQLMAWAAVEQHAANLDLALSDETLIAELKKDEAFKGPDGKFSRLAFENLLGQMGLSEQGFLKLRRRDELREQLTTALINGIAVPDAMVDLTNAWREEKRVAQYFTIDAEKAVTVPEPDEAKLKETYESNKSEFASPEFRKLAVLSLSVDALKPKMGVTDAEITAEYEATKKDYDTPERRRVQQIAFKDKQAAEAAKAALKGGKTFGEIAKEAGAKDADIDLGLVSKEQLIDPKIAEAAFALQKDTISDVVEGRFATVLLRVTDIKPAVTRTLADVKDQVRDKLAGKKAQEQLQGLLDQVEDHRAAGKPLKEIAEEMKVDYVEIPATDRFNKTPDGKPAIMLPDAMSLISSAFESQVGLENEAIELRDGGYAWVDVLEVTEKKEKPFDEVKDEVKKLAIANERARLVSELAAKLVERADKGESMEALAKEAAAPKLDTTPPITRSTEPHGMSKDAVKQVFTLNKDKAGSAPTADGKSRTVFKVTEITPAPAPTKEQRDKIAKELKNQLTDEALSEYVIALQSRLGAHINQDEYKRAVGAEAESQ
ncbi:MAG TPA: SurA N-terminal domain-containing protein [Hyphomicrobium sp.]|jgi:peptidyl-prolyl cis-trans isomerase D